MTPSLLIGLGNPGKGYAKNRHNVGFMVADAIAGAHKFSAWKKNFGGAVCEGTIAGKKTYAFKPMTYMNCSGEPAAEIARFYKIAPEQMIVFHDELDLPLGKLRVKKGGGNGGHNGLKSLDQYFGPDYWRVRIGIGHPLRPPKPGATNDTENTARAGGGDKDLVSDYVLSDFSKPEMKIVEVMTTEIARHVGLLLEGDEAKFMSKIALALQ